MSEKMKELIDLVGNNEDQMPEYVKGYMFGAIDAVNHQKKEKIENGQSSNKSND